MPRNRRGWGMGGGGSGLQPQRTPLTGAILEPALLVLLKEHPRHGYNLLGDLDALGLPNLHPSVVYRTLRDMESLGWIASDWHTGQTQGPPRRMYTLTPLGETVLHQWGLELRDKQRVITDLINRMPVKKGE